MTRTGESFEIADPAVRPKVMFVVTEDWYFVTHRLTLAAAAVAAGYDVSLVTRVSTHRKRIESAGIRIRELETDRSSVNPFRELVQLVRLYRLIRRERPQIVHLVALKPVVVGGVAARLAGVRFVVAAIAGLGFLFSEQSRLPVVRYVIGRLLPWIVARGSVIVQNQDDRDAIEQLGVDPRRVVLVPGVGVDLDVFRPVAPPAGAPIVMLASRMLRDKGIGQFVQAASALRARGVSARFVLVGGPDVGNPSSLSTSELQGWHDAEHVEWWGQRSDMVEVLPQASIVCLPTLYREGVPRILLEASACGRPIVTTDAPGCRDVVTDNRTGLLVAPGDVPALTRALQRLIDDPDLRAEMGAAGRERAVADFAEEKAIRATLGSYERLLR